MDFGEAEVGVVLSEVAGEFGGGTGRGLGRGDDLKGSQEETQFAVPADKCGLVIGKGLSLKYYIYITNSYIFVKML